MSRSDGDLGPVIDSYRGRLVAGDDVSDAEIDAEFPDDAEELKAAVRKLRVIHTARRAAESRSQDSDAWVEITSAGLSLQCPDCRSEFSLDADSDWTHIVCPTCKARVRLLGDIDDDESLPDRLGSYELIERVGRGGFGSVWRARDERLGRTVAIKIPRQRTKSDEAAERFLREARIAAKLRHPNIVRVYDVGRQDDLVYIVSDFVEGEPLTAWRVRTRPDRREVAALVATIATALDHAHRAGVVHRDLKPDNILMDSRERPHITDFGLARYDADEIRISRDGRILGTPAYMSPEQASGRARSADARADIWSLGVMLYELLTDELPFRGNARMMIRQVTDVAPPRPRALDASVPRDLETICLKCLEKAPSRRYATAEDVAEDLQHFLDGHAIAARPASAWTHGWLWCRRNPLTPALLTSLLLVTALAYGIGWRVFLGISEDVEASLTEKAVAANDFSARSVARGATAAFERRFQAVERLARDPELARLLASHLRDDETSRIRRALLSGTDDPDAARSALAALPSRLRLEARLAEWSGDSGIGTFCWFLNGRDGLQLARCPTADADAIGRNYSWRSYFHGGDQDADPGSPITPSPLDRTHLSSVFLTERTDEWVIAISTPVTHEGSVLGVTGLMIGLGAFVELPGNQADHPSRFAVLVDARTSPAGRVIQHPLLAATPSAARRARLERLADRRFCLGAPTWSTEDDHSDPFGSIDASYATRWLAARAPLEVRGEPTGLSVIVQESHDELIGTSLSRLRVTLLTLSAVTLLMIVVATAILWSAAWRILVRRV